MTRPIINLDELKYATHTHGDRFEAETAAVANRIGAQKLGYRMVRVPPSKSAWPCHSHLVNEEMFLIIEGSGVFIQGGHEYQIRKGDVICAETGKDKYHEIINTGQDVLVYMAASTMLEPEVCFYPKSGKFGVLAGAAPGRDEDQRDLAYFGREATAVDYWDGEE